MRWSRRSNGPSKTDVLTSYGTWCRLPGGSGGYAYPWPMARVLSGIQPSGDVHVGNYVGALRNWVEFQDQHDAFYCVVDLHALTLPWEPSQLTANTLQTAQILMAAGIDPERATIFVQSHVPEHSELCWIPNNLATMGELNRMVQFKEKTRSKAQDSASVGLFDYPVLMAADILIYDA